MKSNPQTLFGAVALLISVQSQGAEPATGKGEQPYAVTERGAHHRVWERVEYVTGPGREQRPVVHSYTELATGLHFQKNGQWMESKEEIEILPNGAGAKADQGQHRVIFPPNLYDGMIELNTPDNKWLKSRVLGLSYFDSTSGQSVLIAEITNSVGELHAPNSIIYPDVFTDLRADVRLTYTRAGFEQDIILRERPPSPTEYGLNPETTRLQVLTEFFSPPEPRKDVRQVKELRDEHLDFGAMKVGRGRAFALGDETDLQRSVPVLKAWTKLDGRDFLIEEVEYRKVETRLQELPPPVVAVNRKPASSDSVLHQVASKRLLPAQRLAKQSTNTFQLAKADISSKPGYVLDYTTVITTSDFTFKGDETYCVRGTVYLSGTTTIEGGTVIKYTNGLIGISVYGAPICRTEPYRPAILTAYHDNSVGETLPGSTGVPSGYYGGGCFGSEDSSVSMKHIRACYLDNPFFLNPDDQLTNKFSDIQIINCRNAFCQRDDVGNLRIDNGLFSQTQHVLSEFNGWQVKGSQLTAHRCEAFAEICSSGTSVALTNCLLVNVTNWYLGDPVTFSTNGALYLTNDSGVFQMAGGGSYYLATDSPYRNAGTTNINASLLAELKKKTTYPPIVSSNTMISVPTTRGPQAQRDTDIPDLGYHYEPIDWIHGDLFLTNTALTITEGTVIASVNSTTSAGTWLFDDSSIVSVGTALAPVWFVRCSSVQEQSISFGTGYDVLAYRYSSIKPTGTFRFTRFACPANGGSHLFHGSTWAYDNLLVQDCEFYNGENNFAGHTNSVATLKNNLFYRSKFLGAYPGNNESSLSLSNNLFAQISTKITINQPSGSVWYAFNNVFDTCWLAPLASCTNGYNAYINCTNRINPNFGTDIVLSNAFTWLSGPLGDFYQPTNSVFINAGNVTADTPGLYHFTTLTNQVKETTSTVDIGYHYVAVTNGVPIDTDGDGTPDYLEDANGDGDVDSGETDWQSATDPGLKVFITRPRNGSTIP